MAAITEEELRRRFGTQQYGGGAVYDGPAVSPAITTTARQGNPPPPYTQPRTAPMRKPPQAAPTPSAAVEPPVDYYAQRMAAGVPRPGAQPDPGWGPLAHNGDTAVTQRGLGKVPFDYYGQRMSAAVPRAGAQPPAGQPAMPSFADRMAAARAEMQRQGPLNPPAYTPPQAAAIPTAQARPSQPARAFDRESADVSGWNRMVAGGSAPEAGRSTIRRNGNSFDDTGANGGRPVLDVRSDPNTGPESAKYWYMAAEREFNAGRRDSANKILAHAQAIDATKGRTGLDERRLASDDAYRNRALDQTGSYQNRALDVDADYKKRTAGVAERNADTTAQYRREAVAAQREKANLAYLGILEGIMADPTKDAGARAEAKKKADDLRLTMKASPEQLAALDAEDGQAEGGYVRGYAEGGAVNFDDPEMMGGYEDPEMPVEEPMAEGKTAAMETGDYVFPVEAVRYYGTKFLKDMIQKALTAE